MNIKTLYAFILILVLGNSCNNKNAGNYSKPENSDNLKPNILFFLVDDLGWKDLGCYGSDFYETPSIDEFSENARVFTKAYAPAAVCSPSRASILTGKNPARLRLTDWTGPDKWHPKGKLKTPDFAQFMKLEETTLAEAFAENGYSTCFLGKWHVGDSIYLPKYQGFQTTIGVSEAGGPPSYFYPYYNKAYENTVWPAQIEDLAVDGEKGEYLTERLTNEALNYLDTVSKPFLLYFSHFAVHRPLQAKDETIKKYKEKAGKLPSLDSAVRYVKEHSAITNTAQDHPIFASMVESIDNSFDRLLSKLIESGQLNNTIVIFTSDNGGLSTTQDPYIIANNEISTSVKPLRAGKGWLYEGGIRVPLMISWRDKITPGKDTINQIIGTDLYPTLLTLAGLDAKPEQHLDAKDISAILLNQTRLDGRDLFFHYPHYHPSGQTPASAIISGKYKLIKWYENDSIELYDLEKDIGEKNNLLETQPQLKNGLIEKLDNWLDNIHAQKIVKSDFDSFTYAIKY